MKIRDACNGFCMVTLMTSKVPNYGKKYTLLMSPLLFIILCINFIEIITQKAKWNTFLILIGF